jgi:ubiquitin-conjugating enzyme E2 Z
MAFHRKRILVDIKNFKKSGLEEHGIYCHFNDDNIHEAFAMIVGPKDTPYQHGFYFFHIKFPNEYPLEPPKVEFITKGFNIRFNPNLYVAGKVCLSILGTWSGPGWTSCCSLNTVLLSIQSLLHEYPIQNEPGWENCKDHRSSSYNKVVEYGNVVVASILQVKKPPTCFESFHNIMKKRFLEQKNYYLEYLLTNTIIEKEKLRDGDPASPSTKYLLSPVYGMRIQHQFSKYLDVLKELVEELETEAAAAAAEPVAASVADIVPVVAAAEPVPSASSPKKRVPSMKAKGCEVGFEAEGADKRIYIIKLDPKGKKRWYIKK